MEWVLCSSWWNISIVVTINENCRACSQPVLYARELVIVFIYVFHVVVVFIILFI